MRRPLLLALLTLGLAGAGCGADEAPLGETVRPCLERLGNYVHHTPAKLPGADPTPRLPLLDPDDPPAPPNPTRLLPWPEDLQEYGEIGYDPDGPGANAVQVIVFADEELPTRIVDLSRRLARSDQVFSNARTDLIRIGQSVVIWSSTPTAEQRADVRACLVRH